MRFFIILFIMIHIGPDAMGQKVFWRSNYSKMNQPVGGMKSVKDLVKKEFVYPVEAILKNHSGTINISYSLDKNGRAHIDLISGIHYEELRAEAKRIFLKIQFPPNSRREVVPESESFQLSFSQKDWVKLYNKRGYQEILYPHEPIDSTETLYSSQLLRNKPKPIFSKKESYSSFNDYISKRLEYPEDALKIGLKGDVVITFVIEQSGNITNVEVLKRLGAGCTEEALRLIHSIRWYPGVKDEKAVRTLMVSSIGFGVGSNAFKGAFNQGAGGR